MVFFRRYDAESSARLKWCGAKCEVSKRSRGKKNCHAGSEHLWRGVKVNMV